VPTIASRSVIATVVVWNSKGHGHELVGTTGESEVSPGWSNQKSKYNGGDLFLMRKFSQLAPIAGVVVVKFACALPQHCGGVASKAARESVGCAAWIMSTRLAALPLSGHSKAPTRWE
jgi:hypothetical protein